MKRFISPVMACLAALAALATVQTASALEKQFEFAINSGNLSQYEAFLDGRDPLAIEDFSGFGLNRHVFELITFQRALHEGGCKCQVRYTPFEATTSHARLIAEVKAGRALTHPVAGFGNDPRFAEGVFLSEPILAEDQFFVGLYTYEGRTEILSLRDTVAIHGLRFTAAESWVVDMQVLRSHGFEIVPAVTWENAIDMIRLKRADVILQPISPSKDLSFVGFGESEKFLPIPGVKMNFPAGRRYFVSQDHPDGKEFLDVLNAGIRKLSAKGYLKRGLVAAGVIDPRIQNWVEIQ